MILYKETSCGDVRSVFRLTFFLDFYQNQEQSGIRLDLECPKKHHTNNNNSNESSFDKLFFSCLIQITISPEQLSQLFQYYLGSFF